MNTNKKREKLYIPYVSRLELAVCVAIGVACILLIALLDHFTNLNVVFIAVGICTLDLLSVALISQRRKNLSKKLPSKDLEELFDESGSIVFKTTKMPIFITNSYGTIIWYNDIMRELASGTDNYIGLNVSTLFDSNISDANFSGEPVSIFDRLYTIEGFQISGAEDGLYLALLTDVTEYSELSKNYKDERCAVAYISIDNVEDVMQYAHSNVREVVAKVDDTIKRWAESMNAVIKSYDNEKYIMIFDSHYLDDCKENNFSILKEIRDCRVADGLSITASIGVSKISGSLSEREEAAREAIEMALQRGGDQVVYKTEEGVEFYGGETKSLYKRYNVRSRTFANQLLALMTRSENVIVMGHKYGDFDSFGASVGVVRLASLCGAKINIAVDLRDRNIAPLVDLMQADPSYKRVFVDSAEAIDLLSPDTLTILVDHNNLDRSQFSEISKKANNVVIIDHHRKLDLIQDNIKLSYIEPSASSTCELVSEMIECTSISNKVIKTEADLMLAGILLDTKQFTRNTGTRTFRAAEFLRGSGANPTDVYDMFKAEASDLAKEARFHTSITVYKDEFAISACDGDTDMSYRVIASKAADKMLALKNISAAFTLVRIGDLVHISGRSSGNINVQRILEKCGGGGHFDVAGAQVPSDSVQNVIDMLKEKIDEYIAAKNQTNDKETD